MDSNAALKDPWDTSPPPSPSAQGQKQDPWETSPPPKEKMSPVMQAAQLTPENKQVIEGNPDQALKMAGLVTKNPTGQAALATGINLVPLGLGLMGNARIGMPKEVPVGAPNPDTFIGGGGGQQPNLRENAQEIANATRRLGGAPEPTPGMLSADEKTRRLEDSLTQAPTVLGTLTRNSGQQPIQSAMENTTKGLLSDQTSMSPNETGDAVKGFLTDAINKRFQEPSRLFDELRQNTKDIPSTTNSTSAVSRNILNIPDVQIEGSPDSSIAKMVASTLEKNPSADQIKSLRSLVGRKAAAIEKQGGDAGGIWDIYGHLARLEENTIKRGAISSARTEGEGNTIAQGMLGQLRSAKEGWSGAMDALSSMAKATGLSNNVRSPEVILDKLGEDGIQNEKLQEQLLPLDNVRAGEQLHQFSPESADLLRRARLRDLSNQSSDINGKVQPTSLLKTTKGLNPETEQMLFGKNKQSLEDMRTVNSSRPEKTGQSGTPQGEDYKDMGIGNNIRDLARYLNYKRLTTPAGAAALQSAGSLPNAYRGLMRKDQK